MSTFMNALPFPEREKIRLIAYYLSKKRQIVKDMTGISLSGDEHDDWYRAEFLHRQTNGKGTPVAYPQQVETACRIFTAMVENGQRNHRLSAPFQYGKTGVVLCVSEIILAHARLHRYQVEVLNIPLKGEVGIERQLENRIALYSMTTSEDFNNRVKSFRCNTSPKKVQDLNRKMADTSRNDRLFILPDESHFATAVGSLFDKLIVRNLSKHKQAGLLTVSATGFEQEHSDEALELFGSTPVELCKGYRGPSRCQGVAWPHAADYVEDDVTVDEILPPHLRYYFKKGRKSAVDLRHVEKLVDFIAEHIGLSLTTVRWHNCEAAEHACRYTHDTYGLPVVPHFGKHLKDALEDKWHAKQGACLYIVDTMTCSHTLPLEITQFVDTDTYHHGEKNTSVATVGQGGYGRMCGYDREKSRLITAVGTKMYIDGYKNGFTQTANQPPRLHRRVAQVNKATEKRPKLIYGIFFREGDAATVEQVHPSTLSLGYGYLPAGVMDKLQDFCENNLTQRQDGRYFKNADADAETLTYLKSIRQFANATSFEFWHPCAGVSYDKIIRHRECRKVTIIHCQKKVWAVSFSEPNATLPFQAPAYVTMQNSIYADGQAMPRFGT